MTIRSHTPHDEFFKEIFGNLDTARDFLRDTFPPDICELLDLDHIQLESESFLSPELAETYADLVFTCPMADASAVVAVLLEHKSWAPRYPHLQLLSYMLSIWQRCEKEGVPLPVVIPIVVYQGQEVWRVRSLAQCIPKLPERLRTFLPDFQFLLLDLARTPRNQLQSSYHNPTLRLALELMKAIFSGEEVKSILERLSPSDGPLDKDLALRYFRVVMRYILKYSDVEVQQALQLKLHPAIREITMTMEEQILERGRNEGSRHKAIEYARKMLARGCSWDFIFDITGLTPADLE